MCQRGESERSIASCHDEVFGGGFAPQQCTSQMDCVEGAQFRWHRLRRPIQDRRTDLDELKRRDYCQDRLTADCNLRI